MTWSLFQITEKLEKSPVWSSYKDQKHDLFLSDTGISGYLTGPTGVAGYLTAGSSVGASSMSTPPPLKVEPPDDPHAELDDGDQW
jgi:DnaJ family protein C protein 13